MDNLREKNKRRIKISGIVLVILPVVLGFIRWLTDSDKTVFLIIWIMFMFLIAVYLVSIEYLEHYLKNRGGRQ
ncbi:MAG: hypothetical protein IJ132_03805 [Firmicutes bacterium]|nr:hypothetical protein [Bacillota bacterium]